MLLMSMLLNLIFMSTKNPLMLGMILILQTMLMSIIFGKMNSTFWMSYILFLVFIGGMLIMFIYVISLLNNMNLMMFKYTIYFFPLFFINYYMNTNNYNYNNNNEMLIISKEHFNNENSLNLIKLYNLPNLIIVSMLIVYLFILMIFTSKITNFYLGPFFKY